MLYNQLVAALRLVFGTSIEWNILSFIDIPRLKSKQALSETKKSIKQKKNASFHARSGNELLISL